MRGSAKRATRYGKDCSSNLFDSSARKSEHAVPAFLSPYVANKKITGLAPGDCYVFAEGTMAQMS